MNIDDLSNDPIERDITILQALSAGQYAFGQYQTAIDLLELAMKLDDTCAKTFVMMARIHYAIDELDEAILCINRATSIASDGLDVRDKIFQRRIQLLGKLAEQQQLYG